MILNNHEQIQSLGEIHFFDEWFANNLKCSCKVPVKDCSFWSKVRQELPDADQFQLKGLIKSRWQNNTPLWKIDKDIANQFGKRTHQLYDSVLKISGADFILESSKRSSRLRYLIESDLFEIFILHLVRDGRAVVHSNLTPKIQPARGSEFQTPMRKTHSSAMIWLLRNLNIEWIHKKHPNIHYNLIRYEDLTTNPNKYLTDICKYLGITPIKNYNSPGTENIHNISGSRWRFNSNVKIKFNERWRNEISGKNEVIFKLIGGFKNRAYGYN